jgi:23S rRNA (cytosine1962-C5)-methyltransferase
MELNISKLVITALENRIDFIKVLEVEKTDSLRLFHGINEGYPGIAIDKYGDQIIIQSFRKPLSTDDVEIIRQTIKSFFPYDVFFSYRHRENKKSQLLYTDKENVNREFNCSEMDLNYEVLDFKQGLDPLLFLDIRAGRRYLSKICKEKRVLNLFSYTCSAGVVALANGASFVVNIDFSKTWLNYGKINTKKNKLSTDKIRFVEEDFFPAIRQFAGLDVKGRATRKKFKKFDKQNFDIIFMDPPTLSKSNFGAVDIINDYQSLFKPALLSLSEGGEIICTNHSSSVDMDSWIDTLNKCAIKADRKIKDIRIITPDEDFPSPDKKHPLKMVAITI